MKYKIDGRYGEGQAIDFPCFMQIPSNHSIEGSLKILNMELSNEQTEDKTEPKDDNGLVPAVYQPDKNMGRLPIRATHSSSETEDIEDEPIEVTMGEADALPTLVEDEAIAEDTIQQDRGKDNSFDIPLISVKYT